MAPTATTLAVVAALASAITLPANARLVIPDMQTGCSGVQELRDLLFHDKPNRAGESLAELLTACTRPLLYVSHKWASHDDAVAYCQQDECKRVVATLQTLPSCTWQHIPSDAENELLVAQRMLEDCSDK